MKRLLFWRLKREEGTKVLTDGDLDFYTLFINGRDLLFAKNRFRPDGLRMFVLGEELAKVLGFYCYEEMRYRERLQYGRKMLSVEALERHFCEESSKKLRHWNEKRSRKP